MQPFLFYMSFDQPTVSTIRLAAMNLLSMREHSSGELKKKLAQKYGVEELVWAVVDRLTEQNLQSDQRFVEAFITMRQRQGKGPVLIKMELCEKMIAPHLIAEYIDESDPVWITLAQQVHRKRFGEINTLDLKGKAKQMRFLYGRGFAATHVHHLFQSFMDEELE